MNEYEVVADFGKALIIIFACFIIGYLYFRMTNKKNGSNTFFKAKNVLSIFIISLLVSIPTVGTKISSVIIMSIIAVCFYAAYIKANGIK